MEHRTRTPGPLSAEMWLWLAPLVLIPVLPKVRVLSVGGTALLADDVALLAGLLLGVSVVLGRAAALGPTGIRVLPIALLFAAFIAFKTVNLGVLSLVYPWTTLGDLGKGVFFSEGILVLGKTAAMLGVYVLFYSQLRTREAINAVLKLNMACLLVVVGWGLIQYFGLGHKVLTSTFRNIHTLQVSYDVFRVEDPWLDDASVGHEHLGACMIIALSLLGALLVSGWPGRGKRTFIALGMMCAFILVFAGSRGAWIGASCSAMVIVWLVVKRGRTGAMLGVVAGVVAISWLGQEHMGFDIVGYIEWRTAALLDIPFGKVSDDSAKHRIHQYKILWETFKSYPLLGLGPGGAGRIAEGQLLREMIEGGAVGVLVFVVLIFKNAQLALRAYHYGDSALSQGLGYGHFAVLIGLAGQSFFTELLILTKISVPFWSLSALVHRLGEIEVSGRV